MLEYYESHSTVLAGANGAMSAVSSGIHNVDNGIDGILLNFAKDVDSSVPAGTSAHQDVLDQMVAEIVGTRPALLDPDLYQALTELKTLAMSRATNTHLT